LVVAWLGARYVVFRSVKKVVIPAEAAFVAIEQDGDSMKVTFVGSDVNRTQVALRRYRFTTESETRNTAFQKFRCDDSKEGPEFRFAAPVKQDRSASQIGAGGTDTLISLFKSTDGSLVVRWQVQSVRLWIFVAGSRFQNESA